MITPSGVSFVNKFTSCSRHIDHYKVPFLSLIKVYKIWIRLKYNIVKMCS